MGNKASDGDSWEERRETQIILELYSNWLDWCDPPLSIYHKNRAKVMFCTDLVLMLLSKNLSWGETKDYFLTLEIITFLF